MASIVGLGYEELPIPFTCLSDDSGALSFSSSRGGTSAGLTLLESPGARPAALGEAFTAAQNDISGFYYNPASLISLDHGQASFLYKQGTFDDAYGNFTIGVPGRSASWGLSVSYFNGGTAQISDGAAARNVTVQRDLAASLGLAHSFGLIRAGFTGKYLSSELAETAKATAFAFDAGLQMPVIHRLNAGVSVQNIGNKLQYQDTAEALPSSFRAGLSFGLGNATTPSTLFLDGVHRINGHVIYPAIGLEVIIGPLALRGGYSGEAGNSHATLGTGIGLGSLTLNYSMSLAQNLGTPQKISLSIPFGSSKLEKGGEKSDKEQRQILKWDNQDSLIK